MKKLIVGSMVALWGLVISAALAGEPQLVVQLYLGESDPPETLCLECSQLPMYLAELGFRSTGQLAEYNPRQLTEQLERLRVGVMKKPKAGERCSPDAGVRMSTLRDAHRDAPIHMAYLLTLGAAEMRDQAITLESLENIFEIAGGAAMRGPPAGIGPL
jgi:hypothetical protein